MTRGPTFAALALVLGCARGPAPEAGSGPDGSASASAAVGAPGLASAPAPPPTVRGNQKVGSFPEAKRHLRALYAEAPGAVELYGGCALEGGRAPDAGADEDDEAGKPEPLGIASAGCCFRGKVELSWEHAVPASAFGRSFSAWRDGDPACVDARGRHFKGRKCASKVSAEFRRLEGDLYNLYPAIRALNEARGNLPLGEVEGEERRFGACDFELGPDAAEPRPAVRGELARAYLYMDAAYPGLGIVGAELRALFLRWDAEDPPDAWERERARRIAAVQGNENPFVARAH